MAMQSVLPSVLPTFARTPWYAGYADTTAAWGLDPLADQQLAGAIMWIPAGVYLAAALALLASWVRAAEEGTTHRGGTESRERDEVLIP
jgi:putative membrane protein